MQNCWFFFLSGWFIENVGLRNAIRKKGEELGEDGLEYLKQVDARMRNDYEKRAEKRREKKRQKREEMERKLEAEKALLPQVVPDQNHAAVAVWFLIDNLTKNENPTILFHE